ncbi:alpha/beta fold hydrolase [Legionella taurinensis]|uniref:alpha/beta fold hydrolase n=1 Tax=Legionella taurinensis TaxID=70611 RepID=UPI000E012813|nr:alpha/beta hydrolase [Legionella taurinensis]STY25452.1 lipolytic protein [Legionella taurinensis]
MSHCSVSKNRYDRILSQGDSPHGKRGSAFSLGIDFICFFGELTARASSPPIAYTDTGKGPALVFIHAFPTDKRLWVPQQTLASQFRVISLDLWGFGQSQSVSGEAVSMSDYADEVALLLQHLRIKKAIVAGESMGGYVALAFLKKYPLKTAGLILSDTQSVADTVSMQEKREQAAQDILQHGNKAFIEGFLPKALSAHASTALRTWLHHVLSAQSPAAMASALRGMAMREDATSLLAETDVPVLFITGEEDALIAPEQSRAMQAITKQSRLVVIEEAGHLANLEKPGEWNQAVIDFFTLATGEEGDKR